MELLWACIVLRAHSVTLSCVSLDSYYPIVVSIWLFKIDILKTNNYAHTKPSRHLDVIFTQT